MKNYERAMIEIIELANEDIVTASLETPDFDWGEIGGGNETPLA